MGRWVLPMPITIPTANVLVNDTPLPSRRPVAQAMEGEVLEGLLQHLQMELQASYTYWSLAIWFSQRDLDGFAAYAKGESDGERAHAALFADYLVGRGQPIRLMPLEQPRQDWLNVEDVLVSVFAMEAEVTTSLQQLYGLAERCADFRTSVFLDPLIKGQVDAENEVGNLLGKVRLCGNDMAALLGVDQALQAGARPPQLA
jgi:ferritin